MIQKLMVFQHYFEFNEGARSVGNMFGPKKGNLDRSMRQLADLFDWFVRCGVYQLTSARCFRCRSGRSTPGRPPRQRRRRRSS